MSSSRLYPSLASRLGSVWYRHFRTYSKDIVSNGFPPFMEPLIFLAGMGLGMARYVPSLVGMSYLQFLATGLVMTSAMFTASFECTFGTFIRLEYDKIYDGMLAAPLSVVGGTITDAVPAKATNATLKPAGRIFKKPSAPVATSGEGLSRKRTLVSAAANDGAPNLRAIRPAKRQFAMCRAKAVT